MAFRASRSPIGLGHKATSPHRRYMSAQNRLTLVMVADVAREGVEAFQLYEAAVLPMLERHDGRLERRLARQMVKPRCTSCLSVLGPGTTRTSLIQSAQLNAPCLVCPAFRGVASLDFMPRWLMPGSRTPWV